MDISDLQNLTNLISNSTNISTTNPCQNVYQIMGSCIAAISVIAGIIITLIKVCNKKPDVSDADLDDLKGFLTNIKNSKNNPLTAINELTNLVQNENKNDVIPNPQQSTSNTNTKIPA